MPGKHSILALADDLTGALEIGASFAEHGLPSIVVTDLNSLSHDESPYSALVIDTETRHLSAIDAGNRVRDFAQKALRFRPSLVYKKTDSTLRGNIGAELRALGDVFPAKRPVYAPAYPDLGRTVKSGELFVWGTPVHKTEFASDPLNPVRDCRIESALDGIDILVLDGESNADVEAAVHAILAEPAPHLCAGPAALAGALARHLQSGVGGHAQLRKVSRCLVINGSLHPVSGQQMIWAQDQGLFNDKWMRWDANVAGAGMERAIRTGEGVHRILQSAAIDAVVVFGGDTAYGIHLALGRPPFRPLAELAPGVPVSQSGGLLWVTKAGGFGPPDILRIIKDKLT